MSESPSSEESWSRIWQSKTSGIWCVLTESEFKQFPLEQLAINWVASKEATA